MGKPESRHRDSPRVDLTAQKREVHTLENAFNLDLCVTLVRTVNSAPSAERCNSATFSLELPSAGVRYRSL